MNISKELIKLLINELYYPYINKLILYNIYNLAFKKCQLKMNKSIGQNKYDIQKEKHRNSLI